MTSGHPEVVEREVHIKARPETVFAYFTFLRRGGPALQGWGERRLLRFVVDYERA